MRSLFYHIHTYFRWYLLLFLIFLGGTLWYVVLRENRHGLLTVSFLDIGQGDAIFIESPTGTQVLVDGGPGNALEKEVRSVVPWYDRHIDMLFVTNPDKDHYEGFISLLDKYSVDAEMESGVRPANDTYNVFEQKLKNKNVTQILGKRGQVIDLGGGAYLQVLFPDRDVSGLASNDASLVMRLVYGKTSVALQGDSTAKIEHYLVGLDGQNLQSTILKSGHHGSKTSNTEEYIAMVSPQWTVMSSGIDNSYGHPNQETLDTLTKLKIPALDTCTMGRITFESDGNEFTLETKEKPAEAGCKSI